MNYQTPPTVTGSDVLTSSAWNTYVRDNIDVVINPATVSLVTDATVTYPVGSYPASGYQPVQWQRIDWTSEGTWWDVSSPTRISIQRDGYYQIAVELRMNGYELTPGVYVDARQYAFRTRRYVSGVLQSNSLPAYEIVPYYAYATTLQYVSASISGIRYFDEGDELEVEARVNKKQTSSSGTATDFQLLPGSRLSLIWSQA